MINKFLTIEEELLQLQKKSEHSALTIEEILSILSEKGQLVIILILSLPFCLPIQIPGLSTPFGVAIAFMGLKLAFGKNTWLPKRILTTQVSSHIIQTVSAKILFVLNKIKPWMHPRLVWLCHHPISQVMNGLLIAFLGVLLALPLPIPLSNLISAWTLFILGLGLLNDDGIFVMTGYILSMITFACFITIMLMIKHIF